MSSTNDLATVAEQELKPVPVVVRAVTGKGIDPSTGFRWFKKGIAGVELEVKYVGRQPRTTEAAVRAFIEGVTQARLARMKKQAADATSEELEAAGLNRPAKAGC